jgi:hypothetical protein
MEELDLLKKDWQKSGNAFEQLSENDIYRMLHRKSSSIVKWILVISILELALWTAVSFIGNTDDYLQKINRPEVVGYLRALNFFHYAVIAVLIFLFYKNYVRITATASTRDLMKDIIRTRKTVQFYVWYNLAMMTLIFILGFFVHMTYNPEVSQLLERSTSNSSFMAGIIIGMLVFIILFVGLFWLFYRLIYGILLRKLLCNYKELKKIDL